LEGCGTDFFVDNCRVWYDFDKILNDKSGEKCVVLDQGGKTFAQTAKYTCLSNTEIKLTYDGKDYTCRGEEHAQFELKEGYTAKTMLFCPKSVEMYCNP